MVTPRRSQRRLKTRSRTLKTGPRAPVRSGRRSVKAGAKKSNGMTERRIIEIDSGGLRETLVEGLWKKTAARSKRDRLQLQEVRRLAQSTNPAERMQALQRITAGIGEDLDIARNPGEVISSDSDREHMSVVSTGTPSRERERELIVLLGELVLRSETATHATEALRRYKLLLGDWESHFVDTVLDTCREIKRKRTSVANARKMWNEMRKKRTA